MLRNTSVKVEVRSNLNYSKDMDVYLNNDKNNKNNNYNKNINNIPTLNT